MIFNFLNQIVIVLDIAHEIKENCQIVDHYSFSLVYMKPFGGSKNRRAQKVMLLVLCAEKR